MAFVQARADELGSHVYASTDWDNNRIILAVDSLAQTELSSYEGTDVAGLRVDVLPAVVSPNEYDAAILKIDKEQFPNSDRIEAYGLPPDTSVIDVWIGGLEEMKESELSDLDATLERITGQPVHLENSPELVATARGNFESPWEGGGVMRHNHSYDIYYGVCTNGFSVLEGVYGRVLGARHCDQSGSGTNWAWTNFAETATFTNGGSAVQLGATNLDTMLIDPVNGTEGTVFGGAWNEPSTSARFRLSVNGAARAHIGDYVCTSGAISGEHYSNGCLIRVDEAFDVPCSATASGLCHRFWAYNIIQYGTSNAKGDSGGPVYANLGNDRVGARGIIWGANVNTEVACGYQKVRPLEPVPTTCYNVVLFSDIMDDLEYWDVDIETN